MDDTPPPLLEPQDVPSHTEANHSVKKRNRPDGEDEEEPSLPVPSLPSAAPTKRTSSRITVIEQQKRSVLQQQQQSNTLEHPSSTNPNDNNPGNSNNSNSSTNSPKKKSSTPNKKKKGDSTKPKSPSSKDPHNNKKQKLTQRTLLLEQQTNPNKENKRSDANAPPVIVNVDDNSPTDSNPHNNSRNHPLELEVEKRLASRPVHPFFLGSPKKAVAPPSSQQAVQTEEKTDGTDPLKGNRKDKRMISYYYEY